MRKSLKDFQTKEEAGIQLIPVSINLSRYDFIGRDMVQIISDLMDRYHRQRSLLEIEITESAYADSPEDMEVQIERFHKAGFQVWMDDFGSGYSSLNLLQDTNFDLIKLDMRFMRNFGEKNELIIGAMLSMANLMGVKTLAEGVEEEEQLNFLRNAGCQRIQGYYYDCPRPLDYIIEHKDQLPIEDLSDMDFYEQVSQFNLSDPFSYSQDSLVSGLISAVPCCISVWNDETEQLLLIKGFPIHSTIDSCLNMA